MGILAFCLDVTVEYLGKLRWFAIEGLIYDHIVLAWLVLILMSVTYVLIGSCLTILVAPSAMGSGVAEAMGLLNGVKYPGYISLKVMIVKFLGMALAVSGGICGGKEGPLIHIGSIMGQLCAFLPFKIFTYFRNDVERRKLQAVGIAAGVSAAFGSPIGGSLFAFELSKPDTFWTFSLTWKVFSAASFSTFILSILKQMKQGEFAHIKLVNTGTVKLSASVKDVPYLDVLVASIIIGIIGGLIGGVFIKINNKVNFYRKKILTQKWAKIVEALFIVALTVSVFYLASVFRPCVPAEELDFLVMKKVELKQFNCEEGYYNRLATMLFDS